MRIHLEQVRREPIAWDEVVPVDAEELGREEVVDLGPVRWRGRVTVAETADEGPAFYLKAYMDYEQTLACQRCLEPVRDEVRGEVALVLRRESAQPMQGEHQLEEEDLGIVYVGGETFDTRPLLLEQMQLAVPMKPLCREDCKGLCPHCGANRNEGGCDCEDEWVDPRWAALEALKSGE